MSTPTTAGSKREEEAVIFVIDDGKATRRALETGLADTTHIEILHGLEAGTKTITGPYRVLRDLEDGDAVREESSSDDDQEDGGEAEGEET